MDKRDEDQGSAHSTFEPEIGNPDDSTPYLGSLVPPVEPKRVQGRFAKGSSGNPKGRPRKRVRPSTERELLRDFFAEMEREIDVGGEKIAVTRALLRQRISAAGKGDAKEAAKLLDEYGKNVLKLGELNKEDSSYLEAVERRFGHREHQITDRELLDFLYDLRRKAKKL